MDKTPIQILAEALAEMTGRAVEAERQLAEEKASSDSWYKSYLNTKAELEKVQKQLADEIEAHQETKIQLKKAEAKIPYKQERGASNEPF